MKIALNMGRRDVLSNKEQMQELERTILAAKEGDWNAKNNLVRKFMPLLASLAEKRADSPRNSGKLVEAGKIGLQKAARKYKKSIRPEKFQVFALDFIEREMDAVLHGSRGFFARIFGG